MNRINAKQWKQYQKRLVLASIIIIIVFRLPKSPILSNWRCNHQNDQAHYIENIGTLPIILVWYKNLNRLLYCRPLKTKQLQSTRQFQYEEMEPFTKKHTRFYNLCQIFELNSVTAQRMKFCMKDLVTFTKETLNGKPHFFVQ